MRWVVLVVVGLAARSALACSLVEGFLPPSNYELVATSPIIVIGKVLPDQAPPGQLFIEVTRVLRGPAREAGFRGVISGSVEPSLGPSPPFDFSQSRPVRHGQCFAKDYVIGKQYLFLMVRNDRTIVQRQMPLARNSEEVTDGDAWTAAVTAYIRIAEMPTLEARHAAFLGLIAKGRERTATPADKAIAADVARHLDMPSEEKTTAELIAMYERLRQGRSDGARIDVILAIARRGEAEAIPFMKARVAELVAAQPPRPTVRLSLAIRDFFERHPDPSVVRALAKAYATMEGAKRDIAALVVARCDASCKEEMERNLAAAECGGERALWASWFVRYPSESARQRMHRCIDRADETRHYSLPVLAAMGDRSALEWAERRLARSPTRPDPPPPPPQYVYDLDRLSDDRELALRVIAASPLPEADALVGKLIADGGEDLLDLIAGYKTATHARVDARLTEIAHSTVVSKRAQAAAAAVLGARTSKP